MMKKTIMFVGAGEYQLPGIKKAREMGLRVVATDYDKNAPGLKVADVPVVLDVKDIEDSIKIATNKALMREKFVEHGVPSPGFRKVRTLVEAKEAAEEIGFPVVVKPVDNAGSRGVSKVDNLKEVSAAFNHAKINSKSGEVIAEEFISGIECSMEGMTYKSETEILVTPGAKQAMFYAVYTLIEDGAEVLIPEPYWLSYRDIVKLAAGKVVPIETKEVNNFKPSYEELAGEISDRTKAIIINSPNNPTGMVLDKPNLEDIAKIAKERDLIVISDEIYEKIIFDGKKHYSIASFPEMKEGTITINGFSKAFAMTGWRLGYLATSKELMEHIIKVHQHIATCANSFVQEAAISAFENCMEEVRQMTKEYEKRRDIVFAGINSVAKLSCLKPEGTFYAFVNIKKLGMNSLEASEYLLEKANISTVPGIEYGQSGEGYVRISFGLPEKDLIEAMERLQKAFN